jgi:epoxide hydrolase-like predicted phosphatase
VTRVAERTVDAVLFDYGGVLTNPVVDSIRAWQSADGIDPDSFSRVLKAWLSRDAPEGTPIHRLETGDLAVEEFDAILAADLVRHDGGRVEPRGLLTRLFAGMRPDRAMFDLAAQLRDAGLRVGIVSNSWGNTYPREQIDALFDPVVISCEVGLRKPKPAIFHAALDRLDLPAHRVAFVDDAEPNVLGARAVGLHAIHHVDPATTRAALAALAPAISTDSSQQRSNDE